MSKIDEAVMFAVKAHAGMKRKGKETPYIIHPLEALVIASRYTSSEDVLAAAVLHDTVEDTGATPEDLRKRFGESVCALVMSESENKRPERPSEETWQIRKEEALKELAHSSRDAKIICLGDKLANVRELYRDYTAIGDAVFDRFNQKDKVKHAWYYRSVYNILKMEFGETPEIKEMKMLLEGIF